MTYKKILVSLPESITDKLQALADIASGGNKSRFMLEALQEKMERMRKLIHTARLQESYQQVAKENLKLLEEWKDVDAETIRMLDEEEK